jgi:hypothetical protein
MQYFLNDTAFGPYSGKQYASKGDMVSLISEHGNMAIVESGKERFPVKMDKLSQAEQSKEPEAEPVKSEERPIYIKPARAGKKSVTNHSNNIQSLF